MNRRLHRDADGDADQQIGGEDADDRANEDQQLLAIMGEERIEVPASPLDPSARDQAAQMKAMRSEEMMDQQFENQKQINNRVLQRAATVLSPEQVNSLRTSQEQMLEMQQMGMKMSREMFKQSE